MTFPDSEQLTSGVERWGTRIIAFCAIGTCVCLVGFAVLIVRSFQQSAEGQRARQRQQAVYPVSEKVYSDAERRGVITTLDLACFRDSRVCPPAPHTP